MMNIIVINEYIKIYIIYYQCVIWEIWVILIVLDTNVILDNTTINIVNKL